MSTTIKINPGITRAAGKIGLIVEKYSPEILVGLGVVGFVFTIAKTVQATRTITQKYVIEQHEQSKEILDEGFGENRHRNPEYRSELTKLRIATTKRLLTEYSAPILLGTGTLACFLGGYGILTSRNANLTAAYSLLQTTFSEYRKQSRNEKGVEREREIMRSVEDNVAAKKAPKGLKGQIPGKDGYGAYTTLFDERSVYYKRDGLYNLNFLRMTQVSANAVLRTRGHVFLNDVYDMLGLPRTITGALCGWVYSSKNDRVGDNWIDFGIELPRNSSFTQGREPNIWLDFNVDGVIYDLIGEA